MDDEAKLTLHGLVQVFEVLISLLFFHLNFEFLFTFSDHVLLFADSTTLN